MVGRPGYWRPCKCHSTMLPVCRLQNVIGSWSAIGDATNGRQTSSRRAPRWSSPAIMCRPLIWLERDVECWRRHLNIPRPPAQRGEMKFRLYGYVDDFGMGRAYACATHLGSESTAIHRPFAWHAPNGHIVGRFTSTVAIPAVGLRIEGLCIYPNLGIWEYA